jgi:hypothetical protein
VKIIEKYIEEINRRKEKKEKEKGDDLQAK